MVTKKVSDMLVDALKIVGIDTVYGIIGSANSHIYDSLLADGSFKIVNMHHEQACVMAAGAHYRASGKVALALVTAGAGTSNAITGILSCWADSIPCIIMAGQESSTYLKRDHNKRMLGTQGFTFSETVKNMTKSSVVVDYVENQIGVYTYVIQAYFDAILRRPGPSYIEVPFDRQSVKVEEKHVNEEMRNRYLETWKDFMTISHRNVDLLETIEAAENILNSIEKAKRPVILAGNGIKLSESSEDFKRFLEACKIPILLSWSAKDLLDHDHELNFGSFGLYGQRAANLIVQNSDLVIVLGSRMAIPQVGYDFSQFARNAKIICIEVDENEHKYKEDRVKYYAINVAEVLRRICHNTAYISKPEWLDRCKKYKTDFPLNADYPKVNDTRSHNGFYDMQTENNGVNSYEFIERLSSLLPKDQIIVTDMGTALLSGFQNLRIKDGQIMFTSQGLGEMGYGLPAAIGAQMACPNKPVLCLNCDGGMMMNLQELQTIVANNLPIKIIVFNNNGYLMIKHTQKMLFDGRKVSVDDDTGLQLPEYSRIMKAFGFNYRSYYRYFSEESKTDTIKRFLESEGPACLEVFMATEQDFSPKVKGVKLEDGTIFAPPIEEMSPLLPLKTIEDNMIVPISEKSKLIQR